MARFALAREDTGEALTLEGLVSLAGRESSRWTEHVMSDRSPRSDGRIQSSGLYSLTIDVSPFPVDPDVTQGVARLEEVQAFLDAADAAGTTLSLQTPDGLGQDRLGLEDRAWVTSRTSTRRYEVTLRRVRISSTRSVDTASPPVTRPRRDLAPGQAEEEDKGTRPTKPTTRRSFLSALTGGG
jgi:hypothetical protein